MIAETIGRKNSGEAELEALGLLSPGEADGRDPRVYEIADETIEIPLGKATKWGCAIGLVRRADGSWVFGRRWRKQSGEKFDEYPTDGGKGHANRTEALMAASADFLRWAGEQKAPAGIIASVTAWRSALDRKTAPMPPANGNGSTGSSSLPPANGKHKPSRGKLSPANTIRREDLCELHGGAPAGPKAAGREALVSIDEIRVADNVRKEFDQAGIDSLAETLRTVGMLQRPIVRPIDLKGAIANPKWEYELVAGERRLRAAIKAGWTTVPVVVQELDDQSRLRVQFTENLQRKNLNPIEEAELLARATKPIDAGGLGMTQAEAGQLLSEPLKQSDVSKSISLLTLPEWAQKLVIRGSITPKPAQALLRFCDRGPVERAARKVLDRQLRQGGAPTSDEIANWKWAIRRELQQLEEQDHVPVAGWVTYSVDVAALDDAMRAELQPFEFDSQWWAGNEKAGKKLLAKAKAEAAKKAAAKGDKKEAKQAKAAAKLTPAQLKARNATQYQQTARRLKNWYDDWRRVLIGKHLTDKPVGPGLVMLWWVCAGDDHHCRCRWDASDILIDMLGGNGQLDDLLETLAGDPKQARKIGEDFARRLVLDDNGNAEVCIGAHFLGVLVRVLEIDLAAEWATDRQSPIRERYWDLHGKDQLVALGGELGCYLAPSEKKSEMMAILLKLERPLPFPAELAALGGAKASGAGRKPGRKAPGGSTSTKKARS